MEIPTELAAFAKACIPLAASHNHAAVQRLLRELIADHNAFAASVPPFGELEPSRHGWTLGGEHVCYQSDELTVMVLDTLPGVLQPPHDHAMHAIIGVFEGCEEQCFFARSKDGAVPSSTRSMEVGDVVVLGEQSIHAISSPAGRAARAIHVYFGDIYAVERSLFHPDTLESHPYSGELYDEFCRPK
ncbi:MAG: hypothetical protein ACRBK7_31840 [Acidimicrobiales bacterium]